MLLHPGTIFVIFNTEVTRFCEFVTHRVPLVVPQLLAPSSSEDVPLPHGTILLFPGLKKSGKLHPLTSALGQNQLFVVAHTSQGKVVLRQGHNGIKHRDTGGSGVQGCAAFRAEQPHSPSRVPCCPHCSSCTPGPWLSPHSPSSAPQLWVQDKAFLEGHVMC